MSILPTTRIYVGANAAGSLAKGSTKVWPPFSPASIDGLTIWLDAVDYTPGVWSNKVTGGPVATIPGTPLPTVSPVTLNGLPVVRFTATKGRVRFTGTGIDKDWTVAVVARIWGTTGGRVVAAAYPAGGNVALGWYTTSMDVAYCGRFFAPDVRKPFTTAWKMYSVDCSTPTVAPRLFADGTLMSTMPTPPAPSTFGGTFNLSGYGTTEESADCEVAEVVQYNRKLTDPERQQVESYLRTKWGPF